MYPSVSFVTGPDLPHLLSTYTTGKITLLTFFYTLCTDPQGCPLAWNAFESVREKIKADPVLHGKARLVFFSFDPVHDNGETLLLFRGKLQSGFRYYSLALHRVLVQSVS